MAETGQTKPVPRFDSEGNRLKTGHAIGSLAQQIPLGAEAERREALHAHIAESGERDSDLTAAFKEAEAAFAGGRPSVLAEAENAMDAAIKQKNASAGERVAYSRLSPSKRQAQDNANAFADVLEQRGLVAPLPNPAGDEYAEDDELEDEQAADGFYETASGLYEVKDGVWSPVQMSDETEDEEEPPEDQWPNYLSTGNNEGFADLTTETDDDTEDYEDAA
jgi:hypothetical protein